jgi:low temperature requirement protein LtrA
MNFDAVPNSQSFATVLGWQSRVRIVVSLVYAAATMALQFAGMLRGDVASIALTLGGYIVMTLLTTLWAQRLRTGVEIAAGLAITADIAFLFAVTGVTSSPA